MQQNTILITTACEIASRRVFYYAEGLMMKEFLACKKTDVFTGELSEISSIKYDG